MLRRVTAMTSQSRRAVWTALGVIGTAVALSFTVATANATTVGFCGGTYNGGQFCSRQASFSLNSIAASTYSVDDVCVYRATANYDGAPSASGQEYCIRTGSSDVVQPFYGYTGNPTVHNRHSYQVVVGASYDRN